MHGGTSMKNIVTYLVIQMLILLTLVTFTQALDVNKTIYVDDDGGTDYSTIQDAINAAENGDTIYVYSGKYNEKIFLKSYFY